MVDVHVPEYSSVRRVTSARQGPAPGPFVFAAAQPPKADVLPALSMSVHVPVTGPCAPSGTAVQVPMNAMLPFVALHVPYRAPGRSLAESRRIASCAPATSAAARSRSQTRERVFTEFSEGHFEHRPRTEST